MKERPILFNGAMVRAILSGAKTQTRRMVKPQPVNAGAFVLADDGCTWMHAAEHHIGDTVGALDINGEVGRCPFGVVGDRLWVRETWALAVHASDDTADHNWCWYRADNHGDDYLKGGRWRPSIHMPRWASRLSLTITDVRVQRLQDISDVDAVAEGIKRADGKRYMVDKTDLTRGTWPGGAVGDFAALWDSINGPESWDTNPWVWAITFERGAQ